MKKCAITLTLMLILNSSVFIFAHEGHKLPGNPTALHGGVIKSTESHYLEATLNASKIKIFVYDHDMKIIGTDKFKIFATVTFPKSKKPTNLELIAANDFFEGTVETKGIHRFTLNLALTKNGKTEKISFNLEP